MGLGSFILGGAVAGAGKAMQLQQEDDVVARREARLEALRAAERQEDRANRIEDFDRQETATANRDLRLNNFDIAKENRTLANESTLAAMGAEAKAQAEAREEQRLYRIETFRSKLDIAKSAADKKIAAALDRGDIQDIIQDDDGNVFAIDGSGKGRRVEGVRGKVTPKEKAEGGSTLLSQTGGAPKPKATTPPATSGGGMLTDAQAEEFVNNPANKGKSFVASDGKRYVVQ